MRRDLNGSIIEPGSEYTIRVEVSTPRQYERKDFRFEDRLPSPVGGWWGEFASEDDVLQSYWVDLFVTVTDEDRIMAEPLAYRNAREGASISFPTAAEWTAFQLRLMDAAKSAFYAHARRELEKSARAAHCL